MQKKKYDVLMDTKIGKKGGSVNLTERQARYYLLANKIEPAKGESPKKSDNKSNKIINKGDK